MAHEADHRTPATRRHDRAPYDPKRPYREQGNVAAVTTEETVTDLEVTGTIPRELSCLFVRNGSKPPAGTSLRWFLGDGGPTRTSPPGTNTGVGFHGLWVDEAAL